MESQPRVPQPRVPPTQSHVLGASSRDHQPTATYPGVPSLQRQLSGPYSSPVQATNVEGPAEMCIPLSPSGGLPRKRPHDGMWERTASVEVDILGGGAGEEVFKNNLLLPYG